METALFSRFFRHEHSGEIHETGGEPQAFTATGIAYPEGRPHDVVFHLFAFVQFTWLIPLALVKVCGVTGMKKAVPHGMWERPSA